VHRLSAILLGLAVALVVAACGGGVSDAQARKIAAEWFSDAEKAAGEVVREVKTTDPLRADMNGTAGWSVQVSGTEDSTGALKIVFVFVDSATGEVTKMGEGVE
jgi:ABC-type glycerol-3-phosphate transport system substrate-binding protein